MIIYKIINLLNNKIYIGQTKSPLWKRWNGHCSNQQAERCHIGRAIKKHGRDNFTIEKIDEANTQTELNEKEIYWIKYYDSIKSGYNITTGGSSGFTISEELREHYSKIRKGRFVSEDQKKKISDSLKGRVFSKEHKEKLKKARKNQNMSFRKEYKTKNEYNGVSKNHDKYYARVTVDSIPYSLGHFTTPEEAYIFKCIFLISNFPDYKFNDQTCEKEKK